MTFPRTPVCLAAWLLVSACGVASSPTGSATPSSPTSPAAKSLTIREPSTAMLGLVGDDQVLCAVRRGGELACKGDLQLFRLGRDGPSQPADHRRNDDTVRLVPAAGGEHVVALATRERLRCALRDDGTLACWGRPGTLPVAGPHADLFAPVVIDAPRGVTSIAFGSHACLTTDTGEAHCFGWNRCGAVGVAAGAQVPRLTRVRGVTDAVQVAVGLDFTCVLTRAGEVQCWGGQPWLPVVKPPCNEEFADDVDERLPSCSELPDCTIDPRPRKIDGIVGATQLVAGQYHACVRLGDGGVRCWGHNGAGQLGTGDPLERSATPVAPAGLAGVAQLSASGSATCALQDTGEILCWGYDFEPWSFEREYPAGRKAEFIPTLKPARVPGVTDAIQVIHHDSMACALLASGETTCFGRDVQRARGTRSQPLFFERGWHNAEDPWPGVAVTDAPRLGALAGATVALEERLADLARPLAQRECPGDIECGTLPPPLPPFSLTVGEPPTLPAEWRTFLGDAEFTAPGRYEARVDGETYVFRAELDVPPIGPVAGERRCSQAQDGTIQCETKVASAPAP